MHSFMDTSACPIFQDAAMILMDTYLGMDFSTDLPYTDSARILVGGLMDLGLITK